MGSCPGGELSWWGVALVGSCPGGELPWWGVALVGSSPREELPRWGVMRMGVVQWGVVLEPVNCTRREACDLTDLLQPWRAFCCWPHPAHISGQGFLLQPQMGHWHYLEIAREKKQNLTDFWIIQTLYKEKKSIKHCNRNIMTTRWSNKYMSCYSLFIHIKFKVYFFINRMKTGKKLCTVLYMKLQARNGPLQYLMRKNENSWGNNYLLLTPKTYCGCVLMTRWEYSWSIHTGVLSWALMTNSAPGRKEDRTDSKDGERKL